MSSSCFGGRKSKESSESPLNLRSNKVVTNGHITSKTFTNSCNGYGSVISKDMCYYCFDILLHNLGMGPNPKTPSFTNKSYPLFVTWSTGKEKKLRGCIGTFSEQPLISGLKEYALSSALKDSRFSPITKNEVYKLNCAISLLINFESNLKYNDWIVGKHGVRIEFTDERGMSRSATYLPEVAREQGWDQRAAIDSLVRKAGYKATVTDELRHSIRLTRYQSEKCCVYYDEYMAASATGAALNMDMNHLSQSMTGYSYNHN